MSISPAPAATERVISSTLVLKGDNPAGKPVETAATGTPLPLRACTAAGTISWYTHTAPTLMPRSATPSSSRRSRLTGLTALAHRRRTRPGVSSPASVVRSMRVMALSSQAACHSFLTLRLVVRVAARRSTALRLTRESRTQSSSRSVPSFLWPPCAVYVSLLAPRGSVWMVMLSSSPPTLCRRCAVMAVPVGPILDEQPQPSRAALPARYALGSTYGGASVQLTKFPRRHYTPGPTELRSLDRISHHLGGPRLWIKRDDLLGLAGGGNKTRKLEFLVADAIEHGADTLITTGAVQSNHCRLTLAAA